MTTQAWLLFSPVQSTEVQQLNTPEAAVIPRQIDNVMANNLGEGTLVGQSVAPARLLNDPAYSSFYVYCESLPIRVFDSDVLFVPEPIDEEL